MPRPIVVRIDSHGFRREEAFQSKIDADHWREMVEATLDQRDKVAFDPDVYAAGLADSVRRYGGPQTRDAWLRADAQPELWTRGRPLRAEGSRRPDQGRASRQENPLMQAHLASHSLR